MPVTRNPLTLRVYWEDTDAGGVVFYGNYLKFFERARTEWLRGLGVEQAALQADTGAIFVVAEVSVRYLASAKLDDLITVTVNVVGRGAASLDIAQQAWRGEVLLADSKVRIGCVDAATLRPRRIPKRVADAIGTSLRGNPEPAPL
jgi:acyl-CoA thioester hydrolase